MIGTQPRQQRALGEQDDHQHHRAPEGRQARGQALDHQAPDQHHHRQQEMQTRQQHGACLRQFRQGFVRVFVRQRRVARGDLQQRQVDNGKQHGDDWQRIVAQRRLEPTQAVIHRQRQPGNQRSAEGKAGQAAQPGLGLMVADRLHALFEGFQVHDIKQRDIGDGCGQEGMLDDFHIGNADVLDHQEGRSAHHRRHDLAVDRRRHFHRTGLLLGEADLLHHRNGEGAGRHHVGDRRTGDHPRQRRGHHGGLGRPAAHVAKQAERQLDEIMARARAFEQRTEQHEKKHEAGGHTQGDAEHAFGGDPLVVGQRGEAHPAMRQEARHVRPGQAVNEEHQGNDRQRRAERAARRLQQQWNADAGGDQVGRGQAARPQRQLLIEDEQIGGARGRYQAQGDIHQRYAITRRALECGIGKKRQQQGECQMDGPRLGIVEYADAEDEWQRRGNPQLEQRPEQRQPGDDMGHQPVRQSRADVLGDQLFGGEMFVLHGSGLSKNGNGETRGQWHTGFVVKAGPTAQHRRVPAFTASHAPCNNARRLHAAARSDRP